MARQVLLGGVRVGGKFTPPVWSPHIHLNMSHLKELDEWFFAKWCSRVYAPCFSKKNKYLDQLENFVGKEGNINKLAQEIHHERAHRILSCCALNSSTRQLHEVALPVWAQLHELQES